MSDPTTKIEYVSEGRVIELPEGGTYLLVTIKILCPHCGEIQIELPGHHLRALRNLLVEYVDQYPHLTGFNDELKVLERLAGPRKETHH